MRQKVLNDVGCCTFFQHTSLKTSRNTRRRVSDNFYYTYLIVIE